MASLISKLRGTIETLFSIGLGANKINLKNNSGVLEARDDSDAAYVIGRGADPVGANDWTTKQWVEANVAGADAKKFVEFAISTTTTSSTTSIPANSKVLFAEVEIGTAYDNAATISIGKSGGTADLLMTTAQNEADELDNAYHVDQSTSWGAGDAAVSVTIANSPTVGAGTVRVCYVVTPAS